MTDRLLGIKKDDLTNCYLKNGIYPLLQMLIDEYPSTRKPFSLLLLDLDFFKTYNDTFGHLIGDEILKYFSSSIRLDLYGLENVPFRFGGDEFVIVFPGRLPVEVYPLVMRLRENIRTRQCLIKGNQIKLSFSAGISSFPADGQTIEDLMENADKAMYHSKKKGRNRVTIYGKMMPSGPRRALTIAAVSAAVLIVGVMAIFFSEIMAFVQSDFVTDKIQHVRVLASGAGKGLSKKTNALTAPIIDVPSLPQQRAPEVPIEHVAPPAVPDAPAPAEPELREIYLKSGGVVKGIIVLENEDEIRVKINVGEGEGSMKIKKANVLKVE